MEQLLIHFIEYLKQFSYMGVVIALTFEFVPAELVLPLVGYWVYEGDMHYPLAVLAGTIGGTTGPLTLYALGYFGGRPLILKYGKYFFVKEKHVVAADQFFEKYGASVAFIGRFMPGIRTLISIPCGVARMNVWVFSIFTFLAMLPITAAYIYLGMMLGEHWREAGRLFSEYNMPLMLMLILIGVIIVLLNFKKRKNEQLDTE